MKKNQTATFVDAWGNLLRIEAVPSNLLRVDEPLQRAIGRKHLESMAGDAFKPSAMRLLAVSKRKNGYYYIIDGQNRWMVGKTTGEFFICQVYEGLTRKEEAKTFVELNHAKGVKPADKFKVRLNAGESYERQIEAVVLKYGCWLNLSGNRPKAGQFNRIGAVGVLQNIVELYGLDGLDDTLYVLSNLFNLGNGVIMANALKDMFIKGVAHAVIESGWQREDIVDALKVTDPERRRDFLDTVVAHTTGVSTRRGDVALNVKRWLLGRLRKAA